VTEHLLFIDTEASGLPKNWELPYSAGDNWPHCVQLAWVIYTKDGKQIKEENHFVKDNDFKITRSAQKIHGITRAYLDEHGESRGEILQLLVADIQQFNPLIVGHFMEFDRHMVGVEFYRTAIENPVAKNATFCTMLATTPLIKNPNLTYFSLGQLFETLFNTPLNNQHDALVDAKATAACYFELVRQGIINEVVISLQQTGISKPNTRKKGGCLVPVLVIIILNILIYLAYA
jgi:DNA polymerase-3 subunit epsilon